MLQALARQQAWSDAARAWSPPLSAGTLLAAIGEAAEHLLTLANAERRKQECVAIEALLGRIRQFAALPPPVRSLSATDAARQLESLLSELLRGDEFATKHQFLRMIRLLDTMGCRRR